MDWSIEFYDDSVKQVMDDLPADFRASFERIVQLIRIAGPQYVREPYVRHLQGPVWEMRLRGKDGSPVRRTSLRAGAGLWWCTCLPRRPAKRQNGIWIWR